MELREHPYQDNREVKDICMTRELLELTEYHREHCKPYRRILDAMEYDPDQVSHYRELPFLPVSLFKKIYLSSVEDTENIKTVTSSGTSGQATSQIVLDAPTRTMQQQVLASIGGDFFGPKRIPMLVIDCPATVKKRDHFSARTSGILGFSLFGTYRTFALTDEMALDVETVTEFLQDFGDQKFLIFGFTFMVWKYFLQEAKRLGIKWDCKNAILLHGGGWKKLQSEAVSKEAFKESMHQTFGIETVMDYYGMAEQTGSIFMECSCGHLHCSDYSAVLVRRPEDFSLCEIGEKGLLQVMSVIPKSYPGHNLLTEDEGRILGVDDCPCGRKGPYFEVLGRIKNAEIRGCSDTFREL